MERRELCRQVARLHVDCISHGFLSQLGEGFLRLMYEAIDETGDSVLIASLHDDRVVGFVSGTRDMKPIYRGMLKKLPRLVWALAPSLLSLTRLRRIFELIGHSRDETGVSGLPRAELLSIALDQAHRGRGRAELLYRQLCDFFSAHGEHEFKIVVGRALDPAHRFYRRMGATDVGETQVHAGDEPSVVYVQHVG